MGSHDIRARMDDLWYKNAILYAVDVESFCDANGDGVGDLPGLIGRLPYLADLGVTCLWVLPFYPTPDRDNGYDVKDYYGVDPRLGSLDDLVALVQGAGEFGMRVVVDLVANHTSDAHPWFRAARQDKGSRFRDYYIWTGAPPPTPPGMGNIFPGEAATVWTYDPIAHAYYHHRFYDFEPSLNIANPEVRAEIERITDFWLSFGIAGFRVDAASHIGEDKGVASAKVGDAHAVLRSLYRAIARRRADAVLLAEADVPAKEAVKYFGGGEEFQLLLNFLLDNYLMLALAREQAWPLYHILEQTTAIPRAACWANFLRNLDELDLERLTEAERQEVYEVFAPSPDMRIFGRGIRRRIAPMLRGDRRWMELAYSLLFSLPGAPLLVYGDELGMGDDLSQPGRNAVRTAMPWSDEENAGFSSAPRARLARPVIDSGPFAYKHVNVARQREAPQSFWHFVRRLIEMRRACTEIGNGRASAVETSDAAIFAYRYDADGRTLVVVHNLARGERRAQLRLDDVPANLRCVFCSERPERPQPREVHLQGHGYQWFRTA